MNKKLMLTVLIVAGALVAPAAQADHPDPGDWFCGVLDVWFGDHAFALGCGHHDDLVATDGDDARDGNDASDVRTPDYPTREADGDGSDEGPKCLGCGGLPGEPGEGEPN